MASEQHCTASQTPAKGGKVAQIDKAAPRDIHLLTTDALLADLVGGRDIAIGGGTVFSLGSDDARAVLDWYRRNRGKWAGNLRAGDAEVIVDTIGTSPPAVAASAAGGPAGTRIVLRLVKVVAHRFAGLHVYGRSTEAPDTFTYVLRKAMTLFDGVNGSGKTSIANAIVWCLTGHLIRSQRPPEEGPVEIMCEVTRDEGAVSTHPMSTITPMPHGGSDLPADGKPIPADSWVELTFVDGNGNELPPVRREQARRTSGKLVEIPPDLDAIGIDPIAWRIATTMPALLPFLPVGTTSQLGHAVARLTGLSDLVDLAKHASKASERIGGVITKQRKGELDVIAERYGQGVADLSAEVGKYPAMAFAGDIPAVNDQAADERIAVIAEHFTSMKAEALAGARDVLGEDFDPEDKASRDDLETSIRPAIEQLKQVAQLHAIARLSGLSLNAGEIAATGTLLAQIRSEAALFAELAENPDRARRTQLYARVAAWMHDHTHPDDGTCPVCIGSLDGARDPVTGTAVTDHLAEATRDRDVLARTLADWTSHWVGRLLRDLPPALASEARQHLPSSPAELLRIGLVDQLFATEGFCGVLSALKADVAALVEARTAELPTFAEPDKFVLPNTVATQAAPLLEMLESVVRAQAFAEWRDGNREHLAAFIQAIRRGQDGSPDADRAIGRRLASLLAIVEGAAPISTALTHVGRMTTARANYVAKKARIDACARAVAALNALIPLGELANAQVETLRKKLHNRAEYWRKAVYRNATEFAPDLTGTGMNARGVLEFKVGRQGVAAPAQHVSNASALRGALLGFFLAFREHVLAARGGLETLVLDDPQELLDNDNRERLARGLSKLASAGGQIIVTTHDRKFARSLVAEARSDDAVEHLSVHPVNAVRPTLGVSPAIEELYRKRQAFRDNPDSAIHAQDYASDIRVFLESRLGDLFDDFAHPSYATSTKAPTLVSLMDKLRGLVGTKANELFTNPVVRRFADDPALAEGAEARRVLNEAHHDKASISYMDVKAVEGDLERLRRGIESVHEQFRLYRWREPLADSVADGGTVAPLATVARPSFNVPICPDIAAFVGRLPDGGSQDVATERLDGGWFEGKAFYYVRRDTLGFAIPSGTVAIVEAEPYPGRDQNLVIARHRDQVLARRLVRSQGAIGVSLSAQMPDPRTSRPTVTFDESKVYLHRVVGAIFTDMAPPAGGGEATLVQAVPELERVAVAYRVREESAMPLALPGQVILGGVEINPADLDGWEGRLVAVALDDGSSIFKRVGARLPGKLRYLRQFETIGGLGTSVVIATSAIENGQDAPIVTSARRVIGVLYEA